MTHEQCLALDGESTVRRWVPDDLESRIADAVRDAVARERAAMLALAGEVEDRLYDAGRVEEAMGANAVLVHLRARSGCNAPPPPNPAAAG